MPPGLAEIAAEIRARFDALHASREAALANARKIIQVASRSIKHIQRREFDEARELMSRLRSLANDADQTLSDSPQIRFAAYHQDALKEYVEAFTLWAMVHGEDIPAPARLGVEAPAYLNGLCEAASECRRYALDEMRSGNAENARRLCELMEDVYDELITFDYPDALTSNLRRNVDALRAVLERTQSDLAVTGTQLELIEELRRAKP
ncbi:MAG: haloacid dehalogenase [Armatimonadota bacterium]|nr:haloacid dehalogenase [Armatimonadota bacterium]